MKLSAERCPKFPSSIFQPPLVQHELIIEAGRTESQYSRDLWRYRELFYFLAWRDILVRYKQTAIGVVWAQPDCTLPSDFARIDFQS